MPSAPEAKVVDEAMVVTSGVSGADSDGDGGGDQTASSSAAQQLRRGVAEPFKRSSADVSWPYRGRHGGHATALGYAPALQPAAVRPHDPNRPGSAGTSGRGRGRRGLPMHRQRAE